MSTHKYNLRNRKGTAAQESSTDKPANEAVTSPAPKINTKASTESKEQHDSDYNSGTNWVHEGGIETNPYLFALVVLSPFLSLLLAYATSTEMANSTLVTHPITGMIPACIADVPTCLSSPWSAGASVMPTWEGAKFVLSFMGVALVLERMLPGKIDFGPETATGHVPRYVDNAVVHCFVFSILFFLGSNIGPCGDLKDQLLPESFGSLVEKTGVCNVYEPYDFGIIYDRFPPALAFLNIFGIVFCIFLMLKGIHFPSTEDNGSSGSWVKDYLWGTELYPRVFGLDLKRFINCRFSMTFWQLAGFSFCYRSYVLHGNVMDWGLFFAALSQYIYLVKFFVWEMGYMRSIDIIVDRAGYEIQWGCLVWVPAVYTLHSRFCVQHPSGLSFSAAAALFILSILGVLLNYAADRERDVFRASKGKCLVWGSKPRYITAKYTIMDRKTGKATEKTSLLLASGFWGMARHFQYFFELTAAYSWCFLANPLQNGTLVMFYAVFLTGLLVDRAKRDTDKCRLKYGKYYEEYCDLVPYKIVPGIF
jgi:7-dehydrocholesterol reductase